MILPFQENELRRSIYADSLYRFARDAWPIVYHAPMIENWHMKEMADVVQESVTMSGARTIFNLFPRSGKSSLISVLLTPWMWLRDPAWTGLNIVGNATLAGKFSRQSRDLIMSPWYQDLGLDFSLARDQNEKLNFANTKGGVKLSLPVGAAITGLDGRALIIDDPNDAADQNDAALDGINESFDLAWSSRLVHPSEGQILLCQQRTHMKDLSGHLLDQGAGLWRHVVIRCEYEVGDPQQRPSDPRTREGELAFPQRLSATYVAQQKTKGTLFYEGQYQQRPVPRSGGMFDVDKIQIVDYLPPSVTDDLIRARAWDFAYSEDRGDYTASALAVIDRNATDLENVLYILEVTEAQVRNPLTEVSLCLTLDARDVHYRVPRDPGGGSRTADEAIGMCLGRSVGDWRPTQKKEATWIPLSNWVNAGRVRLLRGPWNQRLLDQMRMAPRGKHDDMLDACTEAYGYLSQYGSGEMSFSFL